MNTICGRALGHSCSRWSTCNDQCCLLLGKKNDDCGGKLFHQIRWSWTHDNSYPGRHRSHLSLSKFFKVLSTLSNKASHARDYFSCFVVLLCSGALITTIYMLSSVRRKTNLSKPIGYALSFFLVREGKPILQHPYGYALQCEKVK